MARISWPGRRPRRAPRCARHGRRNHGHPASLRRGGDRSAPMARTRARGGVSSAVAGCRPRIRSPSAALSNATKKPSPVLLTSSPRWLAKAERSSRSCHESSSPTPRRRSSPTRSVEVTMSVNMNVLVRAPRSGGRRPRPRAGRRRVQVERRAQPLEDGPGRPQVPPGRRCVALGGDRLGIAKTSSGALVGQVVVQPQAPRSAQDRGRLRRPVLAEEQLALRRQRARLEERPLVAGRDRFELFDGVARPSRGRRAQARYRSRRAAGGRASPGRPDPRPTAVAASARSIDRHASSTSPRASWRSAMPGCPSSPNS